MKKIMDLIGERIARQFSVDLFDSAGPGGGKTKKKKKVRASAYFEGSVETVNEHTDTAVIRFDDGATLRFKVCASFDQRVFFSSSSVASFFCAPPPFLLAACVRCAASSSSRNAAAVAASQLLLLSRPDSLFLLTSLIFVLRRRQLSETRDYRDAWEFQNGLRAAERPGAACFGASLL